MWAALWLWWRLFKTVRDMFRKYDGTGPWKDTRSRLLKGTVEGFLSRTMYSRGWRTDVAHLRGWCGQGQPWVENQARGWSYLEPCIESRGRKPPRPPPPRTCSRRVWTAPGGWNVWLRPLPTARVWHVSLPAKRQMVVVWRVMGKVN